MTRRYVAPPEAYPNDPLPPAHASGECDCPSGIHLVKASEIPLRPTGRDHRRVIEAARLVLPEEWSVLPNGMSTAKAIANAYTNLRDRKD
jgi:hypothetical protein